MIFIIIFIILFSYCRSGTNLDNRTFPIFSKMNFRMEMSRLLTDPETDFSESDQSNFKTGGKILIILYFSNNIPSNFL